MRIGMHEIIEDYLDEDKQNRLANVANNVFAIARRSGDHRRRR